jgi:hypothetical protein
LEEELSRDCMAAANPSSKPEQNPALYSGLAFSTWAGKRIDPIANRADGRGVAGSEGGNECEDGTSGDGRAAARNDAPPASRHDSAASLARGKAAGMADGSVAKEGGGDAMKLCGNDAEPTCGLGRAENGAIARPRDSAEPGMLELLCEEVGLEEWLEDDDELVVLGFADKAGLGHSREEDEEDGDWLRAGTTPEGNAEVDAATGRDELQVTVDGVDQPWRGALFQPVAAGEGDHDSEGAGDAATGSAAGLMNGVDGVERASRIEKTANGSRGGNGPTEPGTTLMALLPLY